MDVRKRDFERVESSERRYSVALRRFVLNISKSLQKANSVADIDKIIKRLGGNPKYLKKVERIAIDMVGSQNLKSKRIWKMYFKETRGLQTKALSQKAMRLIDDMSIDDLIKDNMKRIKSFPEDLGEIAKDEYRKLVKENISAGKRASQVAKHLRKVGVQRADLIARTETGKAQTAITEKRSRALGVKGYIWKTSNDRRVRGSHRLMRNVICFWNNPPVPGKYEVGSRKNNRAVHPGEDFNCRCIPEAIVFASQVREIAKGGKVQVWMNGMIQNMDVNKVIKLLGVE